ncbi:radical SAM protein [Actinomadura rubrisoli]|uniref:Radical SAM protein n=1 Tax=Actinomadura rubrisoli TaxID=2530368 RepID=A0A4R5B7Z6_9ACTN|nr:radical SAM protein [Actinomadura rubrisoli]TDD80586.1 radical SAM protein [Actinomadura rubrisoli]
MDDGKGRLPQFRVTLNARCGRACFFCRPSGEAIATAAGAELAVDDLIRTASAVRAHGVDGIKLTGGDPALYGPLEEAVGRLRTEAGFTSIELISRHPLIGDRAKGLAELGVTVFNMSVDTLDPELHHEICGVDDLPEVLHALGQCVATGVPTKVNTVVMSGVNDAELPGLVEYCEDLGVRTLKFLDVIKDLDGGTESFARRLAIRRGSTLPDLYLPLAELTARFRARASREETRSQGGLGHPMTVLVLGSGMELVVKDSTAGAWYGDICGGCPLYPCHDALMALRLTADLRLQFCLLREDISIPLADGLSDGTLEELVAGALGEYAGASFRTPTPRLEVLKS